MREITREQIDDIIRRAARGGKRADFQRTNLERVDLSGIDLCGVSFEGANLEGANLEGANLISAKFKNANLKGAKLVAAKLAATDWTGACLDGANFNATDLNYTHADCAGAATIRMSRHNIRTLRGWVIIGCRCHTREYWLAHGEEIGKNNGYSGEEIEKYLSAIKK